MRRRPAARGVSRVRSGTKRLLAACDPLQPQVAPGGALLLVILRLKPETPFPDSRVVGLVLSRHVAGLRQIQGPETTSTKTEPRRELKRPPSPTEACSLVARKGKPRRLEDIFGLFGVLMIRSQGEACVAGM